MKPINILLIEDNILHLRIIEKMVEGIAAEFTAVSKLAEGCELIRQKSFDVILLDLNLPDGQGSQTFREVMKFNKNVPVILITGHEDEGLALRLIREGAQDFIIKKNISRELLEKTIFYSIERYALLKHVTEQKNQLEGTEKKLKRLYDEQVLANEFIHHSMEQSPLGIRVVSEDGKLLYANQSMLDLYGFESMEELASTPVTKRYTPESYAEHLKRRELRRKGKEKSPLKYDVCIVNKNQEVRHLLVYRTEFFWHGEKHFQVLYIDQTDRWKAEEVIQERNRILHQANAEKDRFLSILGHDLKGPLGSFVSVTELLSEELEDMPVHEVKEVMNSLNESAAGTYQLLLNLLHWGRLKKKGLVFNPEKLSLKKMIRLCTGSLASNATRKGIDLILSIPDGAEVYADKNMLDTILRNLISNAIKFTPSGGKVEVSCSFNEKGSPEIRIADSGIGIPQEEVNNIFHSSGLTIRKGTKGEVGTGFGLLICKEFMDKHKGTIRVESELEQGTTFFLCFPPYVEKNES